MNRRENAKKSRENAENAKSQLKEQEELIRQNQEEIERHKIDLKTLAEENADLKEKLSARSQVQRKRYKQHPLDISEFETRKLYIDAMLEDAGWVQGSDWIDEVDVDGVPSRSGNGRVDYVLYDDTQASELRQADIRRRSMQTALRESMAEDLLSSLQMDLRRILLMDNIQRESVRAFTPRGIWRSGLI